MLGERGLSPCQKVSGKQKWKVLKGSQRKRKQFEGGSRNRDLFGRRIYHCWTTAVLNTVLGISELTVLSLSNIMKHFSSSSQTILDA